MAIVPDPAIDRTVKISVVVREGRIERYPEGALPELREGTVGELVLASNAVIDDGLRKKLLEERSVPFLRKGTIVIVQLRAWPPPKEGFLETSAAGLPGNVETPPALRTPKPVSSPPPPSFLFKVYSFRFNKVGPSESGLITGGGT